MQFSVCTLALLCLSWPFCVMGGDSGKGLSPGLVTGPCEYEKIHGRAIITAVKDAAADAYNCQDAVEIVYTFVPDDSSAKENYRFAHHSDIDRRFTLGAGLNPSRKWALRMGLAQGTTHRCVRQEIIQGSCAPVAFVFPDLDFSGWEKQCFDTSFFVQHRG